MLVFYKFFNFCDEALISFLQEDFLKNSPNLWMTENSSEETRSLLQRTFLDRKHRSMTQDISEEMLECPPLLQAEYVSARRSSKLIQRNHAITHQEFDQLL